jgi:hypothetical protein
MQFWQVEPQHSVKEQRVMFRVWRGDLGADGYATSTHSMAWTKKTVRTPLGSGVIYYGPDGSFIEDKARRTGTLRQRGDDAPDRFVLFLHGKGLGRPFATLAAAQAAAAGRANPKAQARKLYRNPGWTPELYRAAQKYLQDQAAKEYAAQVKRHVKAGRARSTALRGSRTRSAWLRGFIEEVVAQEEQRVRLRARDKPA